MKYLRQDKVNLIRFLYVESQSIALTSNTTFWWALQSQTEWVTHHLGLKAQNFEKPIFTFGCFSLKPVYNSCKLQVANAKFLFKYSFTLFLRPLDLFWIWCYFQFFLHSIVQPNLVIHFLFHIIFIIRIRLWIFQTVSFYFVCFWNIALLITCSPLTLRWYFINTAQHLLSLLSKTLTKHLFIM